tara:strand:+ start:230 stop:547 length:318 start_codon:yes stop_codon:yes gene_type:complete
MHPTVIKLVIALKVIYALLILIIIVSKIGDILGISNLNITSDGVLKAKDITSTLYTFVMALVLFNLFRPAKEPRLVEGEEKTLLFLFGFVLILEIITSVMSGDAF